MEQCIGTQVLVAGIETSRYLYSVLSAICFLVINNKVALLGSDTKKQEC